MGNGATALRSHLAAAGAFLLLAIVMTWPLAAHLDSAVSDPGDPYLNAWILDWNAWALAHQPLDLFDANIFHPARRTLAFSEHMFGIAILLAPARLFGLSAIAAYNLAMIAGFAFCGFGAYVLGRRITGSGLAGFVAGAGFAFVPYRFEHLSHIQIVWSGWLPLVLAACLAFARRPTWTRAALLAGALTMNALTNIHWLLFGGVAVSLTMLMLSPRAAEKRAYWLRFAAAVVVSAVIVLPFLLPYRQVSAETGMRRNAEENRLGSADVRDWLVAGSRNKAYGETLMARHGSTERALFPGVSLIALAAIGLLGTRRRRANDLTPDPPLRRTVVATLLDFALIALLAAWYVATVDRRFDLVAGPFAIGAPAWRLSALIVTTAVLRLCVLYPRAFRSAGRANLRDSIRASRRPGIWAASLWVVLGFAGSLGLNAFFHTALFNYVEPFGGIRVPARWSMIAYTGLAALAAAGAFALMRSARRLLRGAAARRWRPLAGSGVVVLLSIVVLWELRAAPILWTMEPAPSSSVYDWIATLDPESVIVEVPFSPPREARYVLEATNHHLRLINGVSGFYPRLHQQLAGESMRDPIPPSFLATLESIGTDVVIVHNEDFETPAPVRNWLRESLRAGRIRFAGTFEHRLGGDYVFLLTNAQPAAAAPLRPDTRDASGRTPEQRLEVFLSSNGPVDVRGPAGTLDGPPQWSAIGDAYVFSGTAVAAAGIDRVDLLFQNGAVRVPARLVDSAALNERYPWFGPGQLRGFVAEFPARPSGVPEHTDVQVEIADRAARVARLTPVEFRWTRRKTIFLRNWKPDELDALLVRLGYDPASYRDGIMSGAVSLQNLCDRLITENDERGDREFVMAVYRALLARDADRSGGRFYTRELARGRPRYEVIDALLQSDEFATRHLR